MQRDGRPHPADAVVRNAAAPQEAAGLVSAIHFKAAAAFAVFLVQAQVMEHRPDIQQLGVPAQATVATLPAAEPEDPAGMVIDHISSG